MNYDWQHLLTTYKKYVHPNHTVLEIGASVPERTSDLAPHCRELIGIDRYSDRLPQANSNIKYLQADWEKLSSSLDPNSIDIAIASHVIEHVTQDGLALKELYTVLKPAGVAILATPNRLRLARRLIEIFTGPRHFPWWEHVREYSFDDIHDLCQSSPFTHYTITPVIFGFHNGYFKIYLKSVPSFFAAFANYWEITLIK